MNYINNLTNYIKNKCYEYAGQVRKNALKDLFNKTIEDSSTVTKVSIQFNDFLNSFHRFFGKVNNFRNKIYLDNKGLACMFFCGVLAMSIPNAHILLCNRSKTYSELYNRIAITKNYPVCSNAISPNKLQYLGLGTLGSLYGYFERISWKHSDRDQGAQFITNFAVSFFETVVKRYFNL